MNGHLAGHPLQQLPGVPAANPLSATSLGKGDTYLLSCAGVRKKKSPLWFSFSDLITLNPTFFILSLELCSFETLKLIFFLNIHNIKSTGGSWN